MKSITHHLPRLGLAMTVMAALVACTAPAPDQAAPEAAAPTDAAVAGDKSQESPTLSGPIEVHIKMTEFAITSTLTTFQTGVPYRFVIESAGALAHDLRITHAGEAASMVAMHKDGHAHEHGTELLVVHEPDLQPGATYTTELTFSVPGDFEFGCHVAGHLESGMLLPFEVTGAVVAMPTAIDPASITYDSESMAGMPCHAMGLTIMGDCKPEDVERLKAGILAKDAETLKKLGGGTMMGMDKPMAGGMMDMGKMMDGDAMDMDAMMQSGMMEKMMANGMMAKVATGRIIIDRVTRRDEACQIVDDRTILGACTVEDISRLTAELLTRVDAEAATAATTEPEAEVDDHDHEHEATPTPGS